MDDTFKKSQRGLLRPITSVVVIASIIGLLFSASQTYAMGANEDFQANLNQNYQQTSKLSDFINKFISFFGEQKQDENSLSVNKLDTSNSETQNLCKKDSGLVFIDIQNSEYKDYIMTLYNKGIVIGSTNKFMPNDDLRFYCMIKILVDSYRSKMGYDLKTQLGLSQKNYFLNAGNDIDKTSLKYINTAYELGFLEGIDDFNLSSKVYFQKNTSKYLIKQIFYNVSSQFPLLVDSSVINQIESVENTITRGEYTKHIVNLFEFKVETNSNTCEDSWKNNFSDNMNHDYEEDIKVLADLGITSSQGYKFYSDNYLRYYEFIIMLTKTILYKENQELNIYVLDHVLDIEDIDPNASYAKYFEYAYHNGFLDYGVDAQTGKPSVHPNKFIKIDEINNILSELVAKKINFQSKSTDGLVTRGEFADMLVDGFALEEKLVPSLDKQNNKITSESLLNEIGGRLKSAKLLSKI